MPRFWFDAHLDLAYLAVRGRDMLSPLHALAGPALGPHAPAGVTLPALEAGRVRFALATIFTEPVEDSGAVLTGEQYRAGDVESANRRGRAQLEVYLTWAERRVAAIDLHAALRPDPTVGEVRGGMGVSEVLPPDLNARATRLVRDDALHLGILMENADPIRDPSELEWWAKRGVCVVGLTWARSGRYATGNAAPPEDRRGLSPLGRELVAEMDRLHILHDVSHLSDRSLDDLLSATDRRVIASHSNCRALLERDVHPPHPPNQRHLSDRTIREVVARDGVVGLNLFSSFLVKGNAGPRRATIDEALSHVERVCEISGSTRHVGLGSDMDGGFASDRLPEGIDRPKDLAKLTDALERRGWKRDQLEDFAWRNFARCLADETFTTEAQGHRDRPEDK